MKKIIFASLLFFVVGITCTQAQHVNVRVNFPVGITTGAPGPTPYRGAVWVGPEWQWRGNRYYAVPGYWAKPYRHHEVWINGYWQYTRHGYRWVPGRWK
jgi:hypothetical protein